MWLSHPGSARATSSRRRLVCISKGPPRPHPLPRPGPAMFTREPSAWGGALRLGGPRGKPAQLSQASAPTSASRAPVGGRAGCAQIQRRWLPRGPHAQSGDQEAPAPRARLSKGACEPDLGAEARVCHPGAGGGLEAPIGPRGPLLLAPARAGGREGGEPGAPVRGGSPTRVRSPSATSRPPGQGRPPRRRPGAWATERRPPLPQPRRLPPLLPPGAQQPPPPEPRAAREMAPVCAPRPAEASAPAPARDAPKPGGPPKRPPRLAPGPGLCVLRVLGVRPCPRTPHRPRARNDPGRKDEGSRAAALSRRPAPARLRPRK